MNGGALAALNGAVQAAHSKIGASSMYRWAACPGSVRLSEGIPSRTSKYAAEGTLGHEHGEHRLRTGDWRADISPEMKAAVEVYVNAVEKDAYSDNGETITLIEHRFDLSSIAKGAFGTGDCVLYHPSKKLIQVWDYKHGQGIPVEVEENEQLLFYALGAMVSLGHPVSEVEMIVVQPRCFHEKGPVRRWKVSATRLLDFAADLEEAAKRTEDPNAPLVPGEHCRFCPAAGICPAIHKKATELAQAQFSPVEPYDPATLSELLEWLPTLETWAKSVRDFAYGEAMHGRTPPGWKLVKKRASRKWKSTEKETMAKLALEFGLSPEQICEEPALKSPAQIEKALAKEDKKKFGDLTVSVSSGYALATLDDPREAVKADAASDFDAIPDESA